MLIKIQVKQQTLLYESLKAIESTAKKVAALIEEFYSKFAKVFNWRNDQFSSIAFDSCGKVYKDAAWRDKIKFFISSGEKEGIIRLLSKTQTDRIIATANEIADHKFKILGQTIIFEDEIDWHLDNASGYQWPLRYFKRLLPIFNTTDNTDGKLPYELSRFNHLTFLGMAYWITNDEKYGEEFIDQTESWIAKNPFPYGINWTCAMDVAIRACNLIAGLYFFKDYKNITHEYSLKLLKCLHQHGKYIINNLEYHGSFTANHYLSDIVGLLYLGICFPEINEATIWKRFAIKELIKEMEKQVYPDGCDFEASTLYHRLVLEHFFFGTLLAVTNDGELNVKNYKEVCQKIFGKQYTNKLLGMFEAVLYLLKPNGKIPQIGDNDSGRLHLFADRHILDMRYLLTLGAIFFRETKLKIREFGFCEEALWAFGEKGYTIWKDLKETNCKNINSRSFNNAGWYVIRHNNDYCLISCGPNGQNGNGGHAHNDKLSFELMLGGQDIIVDPGTYVYTSYPKERDKFRSTEYHNTISINGYEQNEISSDAPFSLPNRVKIAHALLKEKKNNITFHGEIQYLDFTHRRTMVLDRKRLYWKLIDNISSLNPIKIKLGFHLSPNLTSEGNDILIKGTKAKVVSIKVDGVNLEKGIYDYSPEYGVKVRAECLVGNISITNDVKTIKTYILRR